MLEPVQRDERHHKWNEKPVTALASGGTVTYTEEETPDWWLVYIQPGVNATVNLYPGGAGVSGFYMPLSSGQSAIYPGRARSITLESNGPAPAVTVHVVALSDEFARVRIS